MTKPGACSLYTDRFLRTEALLLWEKGEPPVFYLFFWGFKAGGNLSSF